MHAIKFKEMAVVFDPCWGSEDVKCRQHIDKCKDKITITCGWIYSLKVQLWDQVKRCVFVYPSWEWMMCDVMFIDAQDLTLWVVTSWSFLLCFLLWSDDWDKAHVGAIRLTLSPCEQQSELSSFVGKVNRCKGCAPYKPRAIWYFLGRYHDALVSCVCNVHSHSQAWMSKTSSSHFLRKQVSHSIPCHLLHWFQKLAWLVSHSATFIWLVESQVAEIISAAFPSVFSCDCYCT